MSKNSPNQPALVDLISRRHMLIGGALLTASGIAFARRPTVCRPRVKLETFEKWLPTTFKQWRLVGSSGVVLPPPDSLSDRLYDDLVTRVYRGADTDVMMLLAYNNSQDGVLQVHRPEICYPVGGYTLSETKRIAIPALGKKLPSNVFTATSAERTEQVVYFTRLGNSYPRSWAEQRMAVVEENLAGRIPDGLLVRASLLGRDQAQALRTLRSFFGEFAKAAAPSLQRLLVI